MSAPFVFFRELDRYASGQTLLPEDEESFHLSRVLRLRPGEKVFLTDGMGRLAEGKMRSVTGKAEIELIDSPVTQPRSNFRVHIALAPPRHPDRLEWFVEKACETGVDQITFMVTRHSEKWKVRLPRLERLLIAALKQSQQCYLPEIAGPLAFEEVVEKATEEQKWIAWCGENQRILSQEVQAAKSQLVLIGPEGDFSGEEVTLAMKKQFIPINLGKNRLRTETAGWISLHTIHVINQLNEQHA